MKEVYKFNIVNKIAKKIGIAIIDFLSQIEDFQKRLWEKEKLVLRTEYVITTDRLPAEFYDEVWENELQRKEWEELGFEIPKTKEELGHRKLPIDTKYFSPEFKEKLLEKLTEQADLDDLLDGLLIKSENWQALNLLLNKYRGKVQTIYIDPPFNKEQDADYLYNVKYKDLTWATMLENRLRLARELLKDTGSIFVRCDYNGNWIVRPLMDEIFGKKNFRNEIILRRDTKPSEYISVETESLFFYCKKFNQFWFNKNIIVREERNYVEFHSPGEPKNKKDHYIEIDGKKFYPPRGRHWSISKEKIKEMIIKGEIILKHRIYIDILENKCELIPVRLEDQFVALTNNWTDIHGYGKITNDLIDNYFPTENSEILLKRVVESTSNEGDLVMDFFLGSGTTTAVAHKLKRKWIGIEMGEHFWTVVLPRMKKVLYYDKSGISKEKDVKEKYNEKTAGGFFKYQILEQYEDTLDEYLLKYIIED